VGGGDPVQRTASRGLGALFCEAAVLSGCAAADGACRAFGHYALVVLALEGGAGGSLGLQGEGICITARIVNIADVLEVSVRRAAPVPQLRRWSRWPMPRIAPA